MFSAGQQFTFNITITNEDIFRAAVADGSIPPQSHDLAYARRTHFGGTVAPEALLLARVAGLLEVGLVDTQTHQMTTEQIDAEMIETVFVGDALVMHAQIESWNSQRGQVRLRVEVRNQHRALVFRATASFVVYPLAAKT